ncbi:MAG: stage III sporulation protein AE [Lawsonibacter sp.]|nr:stage III sporulation protein AE [Lawsonibacter sp.]
MKRIVIFLALAFTCVVPCLGAEVPEVPGLNELWSQTEDYDVTQGEGLDQGLSNLFSDALDQVGSQIKRSAATGLKLLAVVLLCGLAEGARLQEKKEGLPAVEIAGALAITALTMTDMAALIGLGRDTLGRMDTFAGTLLPVMAVLTAATGGVTAAAVRQGATVLFSQLLITAMDKLLVPLIYSYVAVSCAHAAVGNPGLKKLAGLLKSAATGLLTAFLLVFVGYLTASGAIAGNVDAAAVKAAKLAISRAIPVVGSILADASETVLAGAGVLKGTVGVAGMLVVLAICLTPFLQLSFQYLVYKGTAALCATVAQPRLSQLIDAIGGAFGVVLGMTGAGALVLLVSLVSALSAVVA